MMLGTARVSPLPATVKQPVNFNVVATSPTSTALTYSWSFGEAVNSGTATGASASHVYSTPGVYTAVVTVTDGTNTVVAVSYLEATFTEGDRTVLASILAPVFAALE